MNKLFHKKNKRLIAGFTLVETLIAISIFSISILGMMSVLASGISNTNYAKRKMTATYLAQEGIEYIRNMRDTYTFDEFGSNWDNFKNDLSACGDFETGQGCSFDTVFPYAGGNIDACGGSNDCKLYINSTGGYDTDSAGDDSGFVRKIWMEVVGLDEVKITSRVDWTQGSGDYNTTFSENLFNWVE